MTLSLNRRQMLRAGLGGACSLAAHPLVSPVVIAETPGDARLVVIVLRGAMDGLGIIQPYGDPLYRGLRPNLAMTPGAGLSDLDGYFGLHDGLRELMPMWAAGELSFVQAVSTPYRSKRSHFDGQDLLENGGASQDGHMTASRDGWLNRALGLMPRAHVKTAIAVGVSHMILLDGDNPSAVWSPVSSLKLGDDERKLLSMIYAGDPLFEKAFKQANELSRQVGKSDKRETSRSMAAFAADRLNAEGRIAAFSLNGWDTHRYQNRALKRPLKELTDALVTLKAKLGRNWSQTTVVAITEFGRTARENGTQGTDHGTGGAMVLAGGALKGGRMHGKWPGLGESALFENRDLMPTEDLRRYCGWLMHAKFGIPRSDIETSVFPGLDMGRDPGMLA